VLVRSGLIMLALPACNQTERVLDTGTVVYSISRAGSSVSSTTTADTWDPSNLPAEFQADSLRVRLRESSRPRNLSHVGPDSRADGHQAARLAGTAPEERALPEPCSIGCRGQRP